MIKKNSSRISELDGIRGIAILLVLLFHFINNPLTHIEAPSFMVSALKQFTYFGWVGVDLFFVLSGFLIGRILMQNKQSPKYFKTFYIRRVLRIIPVYFLLLILFFLLNAFIGDPAYYTFEKPLPAWPYFLFIQNIFMGLSGHFGSEGITPTWSLAIEEQFYLLIPFVVWAFNPKFLPYILISMIVAAPVFRYFSGNWYQSYTWFHCRMDSLAVGVLSAWFFIRPGFKDRFSEHRSKIYIVLASLFLVILGGEVILGSLGALKHTVFALFFCLLILIPLVLPQTMYAALLRNKWLGQLGLISYSLYLFHSLINGVFHQVILNNQSPFLNNTYDILVSVLSLTVSILFAGMLYRFLEKPLMQYGKTFKY
jgi:peptidoglycan/LPS O-acetylase OafA/YrhL